MWEFCVIANEKNENAVLYIRQKMQNTLKQFDGVESYQKRSNTCVLCLGAANDHKKFITLKLTRVVCDAICEQMKYNYLKDNLLLNVKDETLFHAFVKVYTYFDIELEKAIVVRAINLQKTINLESFLNFRLRSLKKKWQEMCNLTNINSGLFVKNETFLDILKFLVANLDYKNESIIIDFNKGEIMCYGSKKDMYKVDANDIVDILTKIIKLSPKNIKLVNIKDEEMECVLMGLFANRVEIVKN